MADDTEGDRAACLSIVCPESLADSIEGSLLTCYPDSRLVRGGHGLPPISAVVRLKKRYRFIWAMQPPPDERQGHNVVDALLIQMTSLPGTAVVQYALTPTPALFDRLARRGYRANERRGQRGRWSEVRHPERRVNRDLRAAPCEALPFVVRGMRQRARPPQLPPVASRIARQAAVHRDRLAGHP